MNTWTYTLAASLVLAGCAGNPAKAVVPRTLTVTGAVHATSGAAAAYALQATRVPYELKRLSKIEIFLKDTTNNGAEVDMGELAHTGTGDADHVFGQVKLKSLAANISYVVRLEAYQVDPAQGTTAVRVDLNDNHQSETTFTTTVAGGVTPSGAAEDVLDLDALKGGFALTLKDQTFNGKATGSVSVTDGQLKPTGVAIGLEPN